MDHGFQRLEQINPNSDGFVTYMENARNCEPGDLSVLVRPNGTSVLVSNDPSPDAGIMGYVGR